MKHLDEINKYKNAYLAMKQELVDKKGRVQKEYKEAITKVKEVKDKLILEWKRNSN